jgi:hypothetical protein
MLCPFRNAEISYRFRKYIIAADYYTPAIPCDIWPNLSLKIPNIVKKQDKLSNYHGTAKSAFSVACQRFVSEVQLALSEQTLYEKAAFGRLA